MRIDDVGNIKKWLHKPLVPYRINYVNNWSYRELGIQRIGHIQNQLYRQLYLFIMQEIGHIKNIKIYLRTWSKIKIAKSLNS